jgi:hypothetical protein
MIPALNPRSSLENTALTIALAQGALLNDFNLEDIAGSAPAADTLGQLVCDTATYSKFLASEEILAEGSKVFLICDKGALKTSR